MLFDTTAQITLFSLILMRMSGFILLNPILGRKNIPVQVKTGIIFVLTLTVYSFSSGEAFDISSPLEYGFLLLKEFAAGYVVGFVTELFFFVITFAGFIMDFQMGLSMSTVYDPQSNAQLPVSGSLLQTFYLMLFFAVDGHLALLKILLSSAEIIPYGGILLTQDLAAKMIDLFSECVLMGVKFAFPILAAEFLMEMGVGILNKIVPQINVFVINIQLKITVGLTLLVFLISPIGEFLSNLVTVMIKSIQEILTFL
ncbi:flagellar biosynthetic protein FliR [Mediterraneibacter agrestimuris]|uniref:flagellar biosynthetic protein FliR n=1 Tax=Mediterraneibacter agrestimuris TaxID=2941333 RepID=UPI00204244E2|nr:flagellar biosynthetic protein FliR [Mediterraneibacter agrestimuris]